MNQLSDSRIPETIELTTAAGTLCGLRWGTPGERPILALHGWLDNAASFSLLAPLLRNADVVAIDLPGHGCSDHRPVGSLYHFIDYIPVVLQAIKELGWRSCLLMGHSLGAGIALFAAAANPKTVSGLCLIDGLGPQTENATNAGIRLQTSISRTNFVQKHTSRVHTSIETMIEARFRAGNIDRESARLLVERNVIKVENAFRWRSDSRLLLPSLQYMTEEQVHSVLRLINAPIALGIASHGLLKNQTESEDRIGLFSKMNVEEFDGHHHFHLDNPYPLAHAINRFIVELNE